VISTSFSDDTDTIAFDLKPVYLVASLLSLTRTNTYHRTPGIESVIVQDKVKFSTLTSYSFGIPSKNGIWTESSFSPTIISGKYTVGSNSINVRIQATHPFTKNVVRKTLNGITYSRLEVSMINPILEDTITVTYTV
jgi:hypothetical protein